MKEFPGKDESKAVIWKKDRLVLTAELPALKTVILTFDGDRQVGSGEDSLEGAL